jgi:hypothetical protein
MWLSLSMENVLISCTEQGRTDLGRFATPLRVILGGITVERIERKIMNSCWRGFRTSVLSVTN